MPARQPMRGRLWLNDGSCVRLRTQRTNDVWAYDFVQVRTRDGRGVRLLTVINEYTRECLAIRAQRSIRSSEVIETLVELMLTKEVPAHIRSDNGPEFTAGAALLIVLFAVTATACDSGELEVNAPIPAEARPTHTAAQRAEWFQVAKHTMTIALARKGTERAPEAQGNRALTYGA